MRVIFPLLASTALVAAAPHVKVVTKVVMATAYEYAPAPAATPAPAPAPQAAAPQPAPLAPKDDKSVKAPVVKVTAQSDSNLDRMSLSQVNAIYKTCWNGQLQWPLPNTPSPCADVEAKQLSLFPIPEAAPNTLTVNNYCGYDIHYSHFGTAGLIEAGVLKAGSNIARPLSGTVLKASKTADMAKDVLVEYASAADGNVYYDISLITCIVNGDTSGCVGHEAGLQLGNPSGKTFQCGAGSWCDDQAYMYQENLCKKQNPVWSCAASHGLTMDFCASMKK